MPYRTGSTVMGYSYPSVVSDGSGGRKTVTLNDGTMVAAIMNSAQGSEMNSQTIFYLQKSTDGGSTWTTFYTSTSLSVYDIALAPLGSNVAVLFSNFSSSISRNVRLYIISMSGSSLYSGYLSDVYDNPTNNTISVALTTNPAQTKLYAAWTARDNDSYPNSANLFYCEATVANYSTATWGMIEQVTMCNTSGDDMYSPSIFLDDNGTPYIVAATEGFYYNGSAYTSVTGGGITIFARNNTLTAVSAMYLNPNWTHTLLHKESSYPQEYPNAIYIPKSVMGNANGRMLAAWCGKDAGATANANIRIAFSDDLGKTWSVVRITSMSGSLMNATYPSVTAGKTGIMSVVWQQTTTAAVGTATYDVYRVSRGKADTAWGTPFKVTSHTGDNSLAQPRPTALYDPSIDYSEPLYMFRSLNSSKVLFYGNWKVLDISVPPGYAGAKSDRTSIMTYSLKAEASKTVYEKINGVTLNTKSLVPNQQTTFSATQAQWDNVPFGKYEDNAGMVNRFSVETSDGQGIWEYTFQKELSASADLLSVARAAEDFNFTQLPAIKGELSSALYSLGIIVGGGDSFQTMIDKMKAAQSSVTKYAQGTATSASSRVFTFSDGSTQSGTAYLQVTGLGFTPKAVFISCETATYFTVCFPYELYTQNSGTRVLMGTYSHSSYDMLYIYGFKLTSGSGNGAELLADSFVMPVSLANASYKWFAIG